MILQELVIKSFRSFQEERVILESVTALIGPNGSGKSNVIHALDFFYTGNYRLTPECFYARDTEAPMSVTLTFGKLEPRELEAFAPYVDQAQLSITKEAIWSDTGGTAKYYGNRLQCPEFSAIRKVTGAPKKAEHNALVATGQFPGLESVSRIDQVDPALSAWETANPDRCTRARDDGQFFGWTGVGLGRIDRFSKWLFIPAVRDPATEGIEGRNNALKELLELLLRSKLRDHPDLRALQEQTNARFREIIDPANIVELRQLGEALTGRLQQFAPGVTVDVGWQNLGQVNINLPSAETKLGEGDFLAPVEYAGHGTQRAFLIAILQHLVDSKISAESEDQATRPHLLLGLEEPELYLHPVRARLMNRVLRTLSEVRGDATPIQSIYATHSPFFVDIPDFPSVRMVRRIPGTTGRPATSRVRHADEAGIAKRLAEAYGRNPNEFTRESLQSRLATIMTPEVSEGYFGDAVVLVEGAEDAALIRGAARASGIDIESLGIAVIPVDGKTNLDRPFVIFESLGIPCFVVFDGDGDKGKEAHTETNIALLRLLGRPPQDLPETQIWDKGCCFQKNFRDTVRSEVGEQFDSRLKAVAESLRYDQLVRAEKNPVVLSQVLSECAMTSSCPTLKTILDRIVALVPPQTARGAAAGSRLAFPADNSARGETVMTSTP